MTECSTQLNFSHLLKTPVVMDFKGGNLTTDSGTLLLRALDDRLGFTKRLASCVTEKRDPRKIRHTLIEQVRQRTYQIACGYEDTNDADDLRSDPALKIAVGRMPESEGDLSSQPTLSRFENRITDREIKRLNKVLLQTYLENRPYPSGPIILDFDSTDDPTHGQQEFSFFHGFYDQHMLHPLLCYDGQTGDLMAVKLRPGNVHAANGIVKMLRRLATKLRKRWPYAPIIVRADAGFCVPRLYKFCEQNGIGYVLGLITNSTLKELHAPLLAQAENLYTDKNKVRLIDEVGYRALSWNRFRRVIMKAEVMEQGTNRRFVITNVEGSAEHVYTFYTMRGDMENRIKDLKNGLKSDRLSCHRFTANHFRLVLHCAAYVLMHHLRGHLKNTELENCQFDTIRLKLLKVGARVKQSVRRVWVHAASSYPYRHLWEILHQSLAAADPAPS